MEPMGTYRFVVELGLQGLGPRARRSSKLLRRLQRRCLQPTYSLHCSSFLGLPYRILIIYLVKPKKGTTMETIGKP